MDPTPAPDFCGRIREDHPASGSVPALPTVPAGPHWPRLFLRSMFPTQESIFQPFNSMEMDEHHVAEAGSDLEDVPEQPVPSRQSCSSLITWGKVRDASTDLWWSSSGWGLGQSPFCLFPAWLPGKSREWQGQKHLDSFCSCGCAEVQWCKPLWEHLLLSPLLLLLPKFHPVGL